MSLKVRFRAEVALGRFDDAIRTAKTMFAMSRHMSEHPTLVGNLVGISIAYLAINPLEEMLEHPQCPNLYWALTKLPVPLVPIDMGMGGERALVLSEFRGLNEKAPLSADELSKFITHTDMLIGDGKPPEPGESRVRAWLNARSKDDKTVSAARRRLIECGFAADPVQQFPADQVILLDEKREYESHRRYSQDNQLARMAVRCAGRTIKSARSPALFADVLIPGVYKVRPAQVRLDQRIALLRHVEALRLYAAEHNGSLPAKLSDFSVPVPDDPFTGKPFRYERDGARRTCAAVRRRLSRKPLNSTCTTK